MSFIKLEDVQEIIEKYSYAVVIDLWMRKEINSLPSIDPQKIIREMIEEYSSLYGNTNTRLEPLEEAFERITNK